jgi:hypothetical protein
MINITLHKIDNRLTNISASYYALPLNDEFAAATIEMPTYPPLEEVDVFALANQLRIENGKLVSDTLTITSQVINENYVEPAPVVDETITPTIEG